MKGWRDKITLEQLEAVDRALRANMREVIDRKTYTTKSIWNESDYCDFYIAPISSYERIIAKLARLLDGEEV